MLTFGILREEKIPSDKRVPLTPIQCRNLMNNYPGKLSVIVQPSPIRAFIDEEYLSLGIEIKEDLSNCDVLMGVKEVPPHLLMPHKTYMFFSHTYKKQPYNRKLLQTVLARNIRLIDYEMLREAGGKRLLGFGRYAGIVGAYNAFRGWGEMNDVYHLKPAHLCQDRRELESELIKVQLPENFRIVITGAGRVAGGAMEILSALRITQVFPNEFLEEEFPEAVFTQLDVSHYYERKDGKDFRRLDFYQDPTGYRSRFMEYAQRADMYIPCHFWSNKAPVIFSREDAGNPEFNIKFVSDISCDINGPIASTIRPSTIEKPFYAYDPISGEERNLKGGKGIGVSAVDNLPCELPRDASEDFGNELIKNIVPHFFNGDPEGILERGSETTTKGTLSPHFAYLQDYVDQEND